MDYKKLKELIAKVIKENGREEITGPVLQMVLMAMVNILGEVYPQTYTEEQKAQARANIDALSNYDGEITKEKLAQSIQDTLNKVGMNVGVLPDGTDLLSEDLEEGIYVVDNITMMMDNVPKDLGLNCLALLIVTTGGERTIFGLDTDQYPFVSYKNSDGEWAYVKLGTVGTENIADGAVTEDKLASQSVSSKKIKDKTIGASKLGDDSVTITKIKAGAVTEAKLDTNVISKINNNVKTVEQTLTNDEIKIASKNLKFRDDKDNFFANSTSYGNSISGNVKPSGSVFGNDCYSNTFGSGCYYNTFGNYCSYNKFGANLNYSKIDSVVSYIELKSNATTRVPLKNIHILSGVRGTIDAHLVINIPDKYLNSSRELIIATKRTDGGPSTPEDIVMYYADEVVDKQNKQDTALATTSKEVVGAINELFNNGKRDATAIMDLQDEIINKQDVTDNTLATTSKKVVGAINEVYRGGLRPNAIELDKLHSSIRETLGKVGMSLKVLPRGTDLTSKTLEDGVWIVAEPNSYSFPPSWFSGNGLALLIIDKASNNVIMIGHDTSSNELPAWASRNLNSAFWRGASKGLEDIFIKQGAGNVTEASLADRAVTSRKLAEGAVLSMNIADMAVKEAKLGLELADKVNGAAQKSVISKAFEVIELTDNNTQNKTAIDTRIAKLTELGVDLTNGCAIPITYKDMYAGTLHKIGEDWFGLLVKNTNNYEDALQVKLQADGTLIEGTTSLAQVNAKLDTIIG